MPSTRLLVEDQLSSILQFRGLLSRFVFLVGLVAQNMFLQAVLVATQ
jgi:hypothetical protein